MTPALSSSRWLMVVLMLLAPPHGHGLAAAAVTEAPPNGNEQIYIRRLEDNNDNATDRDAYGEWIFGKRPLFVVLYFAHPRFVFVFNTQLSRSVNTHRIGGFSPVVYFPRIMLRGTHVLRVSEKEVGRTEHVATAGEFCSHARVQFLFSE